MRRLAGTGPDACHRLVVRGGRMPERYVMSVRHEIANQIERAIEFGSERDDPDVRPRGGNLRKDVLAGPGAVRAGLRGFPATVRRGPWWAPDAGLGLSTLEIDVDEVAFEVRR